MVLKRLWRLLKKAFHKKRGPSRRRSARKQSGKSAKKRPPLKKLSAKKNHRKSRPKPRVKPKKTPRAKPSFKAKTAGTVTHYFPKVNAAVIKLKKPLQVGQPVMIKGPKTSFQQTVGSMQINRVPIEKGRAGQEIGLEVFKEVRPGDIVLLLEG